MEKPMKEKVSLTLDWDLLAVLREQAVECDRSLSQYINLILKDHVKSLKDKE